jgi:hypothetical protein
MECFCRNPLEGEIDTTKSLSARIAGGPKPTLSNSKNSASSSSSQRLSSEGTELPDGQNIAAVELDPGKNQLWVLDNFAPKMAKPR